MLDGVGIDILRQFQTFAACLGQADQLLQPGGAGGLDMEPGLELRQGAADNRIERKLVAARVDTELQVRGQAIALDGERNYSKVVVKLLLELRQVTHVIDAFVEAAGKLRRDRLRGNAFI